MSHEEFDSSFKIYVDPTDPDDVEMGRAAGPEATFAKDVDSAKEDMKDLDKLHNRLHQLNEAIKLASNAAAMRELRDETNVELEHIQKLAKLVNKKHDGLVRANAAQRRITENGPGSLDDDKRAAMISELGDEIALMMRKFQGLRVEMETDHRQLIESKYFAITREKATAEAIDNLIASEGAEGPLHDAMEEYGQGAVLEAVAEIQERRGAMMEVRRGLMSLHQVLLGIASPVAAAVAEGADGSKDRGAASTSPAAAAAAPPLAAAAGKAGAGGLNDYERETRNQAYIGMAVALVIIISLITWLLNVESEIEDEN